MENFLATGIRPEQVNFVVNTHIHTDHVGWNTQKENENLLQHFPMRNTFL